eukprot:2994377-Pyramimonas_sp.AAC.1
MAAAGASDHACALPVDAIQPARRVRHPVLQGSHDYPPDLLRLALACWSGSRAQARLAAARCRRLLMDPA